jgi:hypothetical protein
MNPGSFFLHFLWEQIIPKTKKRKSRKRQTHNNRQKHPVWGLDQKGSMEINGKLERVDGVLYWGRVLFLCVAIFLLSMYAMQLRLLYKEQRVDTIFYSKSETSKKFLVISMSVF